MPFAAPPVDDSPAGFQIEAMPAQGPDLLVFSASPAIPKGEITVPKASSKGRLTGSSMQTAQPVLPQGAEELSRAEVFIPAVSISSQTAPTMTGAGTAAVQAPLPRPPELPSQSVQPEPRRCWIFSLLEFHQVNLWWQAIRKSGLANRLFEIMKAEEVLSTRLLSMRQISRASEAVGFFDLLNSLPQWARTFISHSSSTINGTLRHR